MFKVCIINVNNRSRIIHKLFYSYLKSFVLLGIVGNTRENKNISQKRKTNTYFSKFYRPD